MAKLKIEGNGSGTGTFTIISPNSDTDTTIELPHSSGTLVSDGGSIIPSQDNTFDLGRSDKVFKDIFVSGNTINLGGQTLSASATGIVLPELTIGTGTSAVKLKASATGKLKQTSTDASGAETPEINIPDVLTELEDVNAAGLRAQGSSVLRWTSGSVFNARGLKSVDTFLQEAPTTVTFNVTKGISYNFSAEGTEHFVFNGGGYVDEGFPYSQLYAGVTYIFNIDTPGDRVIFLNGATAFPRASQAYPVGAYEAQYFDGITGEPTDSGTITFTVPANPKLYDPHPISGEPYIQYFGQTNRASPTYGRYHIGRLNINSLDSAFSGVPMNLNTRIPRIEGIYNGYMTVSNLPGRGLFGSDYTGLAPNAEYADSSDYDPQRVAGFYDGVTGTSSGTGTVGTFDIVVNDDDTGRPHVEVTPRNIGSGHSVGDIITIPSTTAGIAHHIISPANHSLANPFDWSNDGVNAIPTVLGVGIDMTISSFSDGGINGTSSGTGTVGTFDIAVDAAGQVYDVTIVDGGSGHSVGDIITIAAADIGGAVIPPSPFPQSLYNGSSVYTGNGHSSQLNGTAASADFQMTISAIELDPADRWSPSIDPISNFTDFSDVNLTTAPTDTQVLTWDNTNSYWYADTNSLPYNVSNTTELLALTGMVAGQEAIVTDLNRNYVYTGAAAGTKWRHAVSGWYAVEDILTNHPPTGLTGINSTYSLTPTSAPITITCASDDPEQMPQTFSLTTSVDTTASTWWSANLSTTATVVQTDNIFTVTQKVIAGATYIPITINASFTVSDDSLTPSHTFLSTISAFAALVVPDWASTGEFESQVDPVVNEYDDISFGRSVSLDDVGNTLIVSNSIKNKVHVYDKNVGGGWTPNTTLSPSSPTLVGTYGGEERERYSYGTNQIAISGEGNTIAVGCMGGQYGSGDLYDPPNDSATPYVEVFYKNDTTSIWESKAICLPTPYSAATSSTLGVRVSAVGMSVALSDDGKVLVVGYRLEGNAQPWGVSHNTYADGTRPSAGANPTSDRHFYNKGAVYIYELNSSDIWVQSAKFTGSDSTASLGASVDVSQPLQGMTSGGYIVIASAPNAATGGHVKVYRKTLATPTWTETHTILPPTADQLSNNRFGFNSICISKNGATIAVGDIGQAVTSVIGNIITGEVSSFTKFTGAHTYPAGVVYIYNEPIDSLGYVLDNDTNGGIIENFIGNDGDGFGDTVQLNDLGNIVSIGSPYEHNGFYFPGQQVGSSYIHDYTAKRVFYGWHRFSHGYGTAQPFNDGEIDSWNYTEATEAINCTTNSVSYIGFVTPADGKTSNFDLSASFTSVAGDNDVVSIVLAFNVDAAGREHTISLIRSGNTSYPTQYLYAIVYNFSMSDQVAIFNGNNLITDIGGHGSWSNKFIRNKIVRSGDTFTVTTSQAISPSSHTGTNSDLDSSTTHTFSLSSFSFGNLFSAANGGARWGFSCMSQQNSSWVNVVLKDSVNPEEIVDVGSLHTYTRVLTNNNASWGKSKRFYPSTFVKENGQKLTNTHMGRASFAADGKTLASGRKNDSSGAVEVWDAT